MLAILRRFTELYSLCSSLVFTLVRCAVRTAILRARETEQISAQQSKLEKWQIRSAIAAEAEAAAALALQLIVR